MKIKIHQKNSSGTTTLRTPSHPIHHHIHLCSHSHPPHMNTTNTYEGRAHDTRTRTVVAWLGLVWLAVRPLGIIINSCSVDAFTRWSTRGANTRNIRPALFVCRLLNQAWYSFVAPAPRVGNIISVCNNNNQVQSATTGFEMSKLRWFLINFKKLY